jgi:hypothetical protein
LHNIGGNRATSVFPVARRMNMRYLRQTFCKDRLPTVQKVAK